ncbi:MAG: PTS sugar transporter subunit IIA [Anaerolineales bacterium]|nr:MAG: PTS sugar transporter subunit IIA [Anaerolineales bacterium]
MGAKLQVRLTDALNAQTVKAKVTATSWEQAVEVAGMVLVQANLVEPRYIDAMKKTLRKLGPYSVIAPGIAMPHARPEDGVIQTGFSLVTLVNPVTFGNAENDPVDILLAFSASDKERHITALKEISVFLSNDGLMRKVRTANSNDQLLDVIRDFERINN